MQTPASIDAIDRYQVWNCFRAPQIFVYWFPMGARLTHWGLVLHTNLSEQGNKLFRKWLYVWNIVFTSTNIDLVSIRRAHKNILQGNVDQNAKFFFQENTFPKAVCKIPAIFNMSKSRKVAMVWNLLIYATTWGPFYHLICIKACIRNHVHYIMWGVIIHPCHNFCSN